MHPAWYVEDIQHLIFKLLEPGDLARLARTNKELFEIATNQLWATLTSLRPFMSCLPPHYRDRTSIINDVARLDLYSQKVKILHLETKPKGSVMGLFEPFDRTSRKIQERYKSWSEVWTEIARLRPNSLFLPNLVSLHFNRVVEELLLPLVGITGRHLTDLCVRSLQEPSPEGTFQAFLDQLQDTFKLEQLCIEDCLMNTLNAKLVRQSPLTNLSLDARIYPARYWRNNAHKSRLQAEILRKHSLQHLTLGLTRDWYSPEVHAVQHRYLPSLKTLRLNLRCFRAQPCESHCVNAFPHSWTCARYSNDPPDLDHNPQGTYDCGRRSPALFLQNLDKPDLDTFQIFFPYTVAGDMFLETIQAASRGCQLRHLTTLTLGDETWHHHTDRDEPGAPPKVTPQDMTDALTTHLLPLPHLKTLHLTVGPDLLRHLNLPLFESLARGLPALTTLRLGHTNFVRESLFDTKYYERIPLPHLAAFCHLLPSLKHVAVGCLDANAAAVSLEGEEPRADWASPGVVSVVVGYWAAHSVNGVPIVAPDPVRLLPHLQAYFPGSGLTRSYFRRVNSGERGMPGGVP